jgi:hypothetical protein
MPKWNDDEVRAQLKRIEEMCQRDAKEFCTNPMVEPRIIQVPPTEFRHERHETIEELFNRHTNVSTNTDPEPLTWDVDANGHARIADISLANVDHLHQEIATLKAERAVLYKRCQEQQDELNTLKDHLRSLLTNPVFKRQYK